MAFICDFHIIISVFIVFENIQTFSFLWYSRFVLDGFPMTLKQAQLMESWSIIPMIVVELELDTVEVMKRSLVDKMKPSK